MKLYKILEGNKSCHGGDLEWSLPDGKPGNWHEITGDLSMCSKGIHLTDKPARWFKWNCSIYEAEYEGEILWDKNESKCCVRKARLLKRVEPPKWWMRTHQFVERDIPSVLWLKPDLKPRKEWKLFKAQTWAAARAAARAAAGAAAWDAAWDAAWAAARAAAGAAAGAAPQDAAWDAARDAAGAAAGSAAGAAAWDAAWDARLMSYINVCEGLKIDKKHIDHINARWEVWQKGYALLCDVKGVLYVYCKE
jgi:hypothetical protein